jgi:hypothetical protein
MGGGLALLHGFPVLYTGTKNLALIRGILDLEHWFTSTHKGRDILNVRQHCIKLTLGENIHHFGAGDSDDSPGAPSDSQCVGTPGAPTMFPVRLMLPSLMRHGERICFESPRYRAVPWRTEPVSETDEKNIFEMFAQALNNNFMTDLALELSTSRDNACTGDDSSDAALAGKRFIVVGASHGMRLASALEDMGACIVDISVPGWRISAEAVESMKAELASVLQEEFSGETYVIYQLFDNSMFWSCDADGARSLPVKAGDNQYHILGRLVYIERAAMKELFMLALPLLRAGLNHTKVLLSPLMRYVTSSCCNAPGHMTNRRGKNFAANMGKALGEVRVHIQDLAFTRRIRNFVVMCPNTLLQGEGEIEDTAASIKRLWAGPVHLNKEGYDLMATNLLESVLEAKLSRPTVETTPAGTVPDRTKLRKKWVTENDSSVQRLYEDRGQRGNTRGGRRGHRGHRGRGGRGRGGQFRGFKPRYNPY